MEKLNPIIQELVELGSTLQRFPVVNPYKVPAGYFDEFPSQMYAIASGRELPVHLSQLSTPYTAPAGYFDNLPEAILQKVKAAEDLVTAKHPTTTGQSPAIEQSPADELAAISPLLTGIGKKIPFQVPDGYFSQLPSNAVSGAQAMDFVNEELENLSPVLNELRSVNVYEVPHGYFEQFPARILARVSTKTPAKVVTGNFRRRILQYVAAAVVTGLMVTAGLFLVNLNNPPQQMVSTTGLKEKAAQASDEEILRYLETQPVAIPDSLLTTDPEIKADAILDMLADVSDEELQQYVQLQSDTKLLIN